MQKGTPIYLCRVVALWLLQAACGPKHSIASSSEGTAESTLITSTSSGDHPSTTTSGGIPTSGDVSTAAQTANPNDATMDSDDGTATTDNGFFPEECMLPGHTCPPGFKCVSYGSLREDRGCFPVERDPDAVRDPCTYLDYANGVLNALDSCDAFSVCFNGQCSPICEGPDLSCPEGFTVCFDAPSIEVCIPMCDPLKNECGADRECLYFSSYFSCSPAGVDKGLWETCDNPNDCSPGEVCTSTQLAIECMSSKCCDPLCALGTDQCPGEQQKCVPFFMNGEGYPQYNNLGICSI